MASSAALEFTQAVYEEDQFDRGSAVRFAFGFPNGEAARPGGLEIVSRGAWLTDDDREALQRAALQRGAVLAVSAVVGRPGDPSKAQALFTTETQVPRDTFFLGLARLLYEGSGLFGPQRLDRPERQMVMCRGAIETLRLIPETKETKALGADIQAAVKRIPGI